MSMFAGVMLIGVTTVTLRDLLGGDPQWLVARIATALVLAGALAVLMLRPSLTLGSLRFLELIVFGTVAAYLGAQTHALVLETLSTSAAAAAWNGVVLRFALLMVAYGIFSSNPPLRAVVGVVIIGVVPVATGWLVRAQHPELRDAFDAAASAVGFETGLLLGAAAGVAVFAAFLTGNLFDFAFEQRRRTFYDLEEQIGVGGMGEVWRARHRTLARPTALKLIREDKISGADGNQARRVLQRFEREAKATAALRSPHTVDVYDFGVTEDGLFFYAMEYLEGLDLETLVEEYGPVPPERAVHILLQACDSLADAHEHGLTHRDIKPANLFLSRLGPSNDYVKILDFGLVQTEPPSEVDASERLTDEGATSGTPAYMAPEMALQRDDVDGRADIYALGGVAYWLLTGKLLFEAEGGVAMIVEHVKSKPVPPAQRTELEIPPELDELVMKCLEKDPGARYQSARELAGALAEVPLERPWTPTRAAEWWDLHFPESAAA